MLNSRLDSATYWINRLNTALSEAVKPEPPVTPPFVKKNSEIPTLDDYKGEFSETFWSKWPRTPLPLKAKSIINVPAFKDHCLQSGVDEHMVDTVTTRLSEGARLGARGAGRLPARAANLQNFYLLGERSIDTMVTWLKASPPFMAGPFKPNELNNGRYRSSPLQSTLKPNNHARVTLL